MKKVVFSLIVMCFMASCPAVSQVAPIKRPQKQKTEQTQKQKHKAKTQKDGRGSHNPKRHDDSNMYISFSCNATDGAVYIDGLYYGLVGGLHEVSMGTHEVMIIANGYETYQSTIYVSPSNSSFNCQLKEIMYDVTFNCNVDYANLYIDGKCEGFANGQYKISPGFHSIKITYTGYLDKTEYISVLSDSTFIYNLFPIIDNDNEVQLKPTQYDMPMFGIDDIKEKLECGNYIVFLDKKGMVYTFNKNSRKYSTIYPSAQGISKNGDNRVTIKTANGNLSYDLMNDKIKAAN